MEELAPENSTSVKIHGNIIQFTKKFVIIVPRNAILSEIPLLKELDMNKRYPVEIHGLIDVVSMYNKAEFIW